MSNTRNLSRGYASFFWGCTKFAVSPYTETFLAIASSDNDDEILENIFAATAITAVLTFVVPILPAIASFTFALASIAMCLAVLTMPFTYPLALIADGCEPNDLSLENEIARAFNC